MPGQRNKNGAGGINGMAKLLALHERESAPLINLSIVKKIVSKRDLNDLTFFPSSKPSLIVRHFRL